MFYINRELFSEYKYYKDVNEMAVHPDLLADYPHLQALVSPFVRVSELSYKSATVMASSRLGFLIFAFVTFWGLHRFSKEMLEARILKDARQGRIRKIIMFAAIALVFLSFKYIYTRNFMTWEINAIFYYCVGTWLTLIAWHSIELRIRRWKSKKLAGKDPFGKAEGRRLTAEVAN